MDAQLTLRSAPTTPLHSGLLSLDALFAYTEWANRRTLGAAAQQPPAGWTRDVGGSFPTLQAVLAHVVGGEWVWLQRWTGASPTTFPAWTVAPSPADLRAVLDDVERERRAWLGSLTDADVVVGRPYKLLSGTTSAEPLGIQMHHVVNHSTYHRGQAAAMLRRLGGAPPPMDLIAWARSGSPRHE